MHTISKTAILAARLLLFGAAGAAIGTLVYKGTGTAIGYLIGLGLAGTNAAKRH